jgi:hypothetical protein
MAESRSSSSIAEAFWEKRPAESEPELPAVASTGTIVPLALEGGEWKRVMCKLCGNKTWCTAQVYVKDGLMLSVAGDPENAASGGKLCNRGQAAIMNVYNPYRVKAPMKRTNPEKGLTRPGWGNILGRGPNRAKLRDVAKRGPAASPTALVSPPGPTSSPTRPSAGRSAVLTTSRVGATSARSTSARPSSTGPSSTSKMWSTPTTS